MDPCGFHSSGGNAETGFETQTEKGILFLKQFKVMPSWRSEKTSHMRRTQELSVFLLQGVSLGFGNGFGWLHLVPNLRFDHVLTFKMSASTPFVARSLGDYQKVNQVNQEQKFEP